MTNIWFISDTHFNHTNILSFTDDKGNLIRPGFDNVDHMNQTMIDNWNKVVQPQDKIYHLGDVSFKNPTAMDAVLKRLNGHKRLIMGNHDQFDILHYANHFDKIGSWRQFTEFELPFVCSHYPLHNSSFEMRRHKITFNVHGHIHQNEAPTKQHINICVEKTNYAPIHVDELIKIMKGKM